VRRALEQVKLKSVYDAVAGRYDTQHALVTARSDQRCRRLLVERAVRPGDRVLDAGGGTGSTSLLAAAAAGADGHVTLVDLSDGMLHVAKRRLEAAGLAGRVTLRKGDILELSFDDGSFDVALSTYSMCPLVDPAKGALALLSVVRPGGLVGIAHSAEPRHAFVRWLADRVESVVLRFPWLSLGCRSVEVLPALLDAGATVELDRFIGIPLWPFRVLVVRKPA